MKAKDIVIGRYYAVKVSGRVVPVRILRSSPYGGWEGANQATGREVRIRSAQRCRFALVQMSDGLWADEEAIR